MNFPLPKWNANARISVPGKELNQLLDEIKKRTPLAGNGLLARDSANGVVLTVRGR
jgi:hypothetical protein